MDRTQYLYYGMQDREELRVIGAFSFVKTDIPDYCVVVGNPARIVKRYNPQSRKWEKTDKDGNLIV